MRSVDPAVPSSRWHVLHDALARRSVPPAAALLIAAAVLVAAPFVMQRAPSASVPAARAALSGPALPGGGAGRASPERTLDWLGAFAVHEDDRTINVEPVVVLDPRGGFLVADTREVQLRRYAATGDPRAIVWRAGGRGGGPGEYHAPTAITRLASGEIVAADRMERLTFYDADGALLRTVATPLGHVEDLAQVGSSRRLLIAARLPGGPDGPRLHLWDLDEERIVHSFFAPYRNAPNPVISAAAGWTKFSLRADTVAAIFATSDTVYFFTTEGRALGARPIPFARFRHGEARPPRDGTDPRQRARWLSTFDFVADVHWTPDGDLLIPYQHVRAERALERRWHLLWMEAATGRRKEDFGEQPRLLDVDPGDGTLYFVKDGAQAPNQWARARLPR